MDKYSLLGISGVTAFGFSFLYHLFVKRLPEAFNLCYLTLLILGLGLLVKDRTIFGIGSFFMFFPLVTTVFLIIGALTLQPRPSDFWLVHGISTHIYAVFLSVFGYKKKFRFFNRNTWWFSTTTLVSIWVLSLFLNKSEINVNWSVSPPVPFGSVNLWDFFILSLITVVSFWFLLNQWYSEPIQETLDKVQRKYLHR
ncbi:MAG: hypothetical protein ACFFD2_17080 [Promethearchaeota archaeon]